MGNFKKKMVAVVAATSLATSVTVSPAASAEDVGANPAHNQSMGMSSEPDSQIMEIIFGIMFSIVLVGLSAYFGTLPQPEGAAGNNEREPERGNRPDNANGAGGSEPAPAPAPAPTPAPRPAPATPSAPPRSEYADLSYLNDQAPDINTVIWEQFTAWNEYRVQHGLKQVVWNDTVADSAYRWAKYQADHRTKTYDLYNEFPHESDFIKSNRDPSYVARISRYPKLNYAENVWEASPTRFRDALQVFKDSPGHNRNLLAPDQGRQYSRAGIAIVKGGRDRNNRDTYYIVYRLVTEDWD